MGVGAHERQVDASTTAVESLLRELEDAAAWQDRPASRVRKFAHPLPSSGRDQAHGELGARHARRAV